jgi:DNA-binding MarR family transcriptional regulator
MRRATVAEILSLMEKNDLIIRKANDVDGRLKQIILTEKSLEIKNAIRREVNKVENDLKNGLTNEEVDNFMKTLKQMSENID